MEPNPYSPGARPAYLAGRSLELGLIEERLGQVRLLGRSGGPLLAFYGPRGLGKTSLLRQAQIDAQGAGFLTAWVTGRGDEPMVTALTKSLRQSVEGRSLGDRAAGILHRLDQVQVEFGVPGAKVSAQLSGPGQDTPAPASRVIGELLEDAARFARNHDLAGLVLFVDEFHEAQLSDRKSLLIALQEFDGEPPCPAAIIAAGLPSINAAVTEAATFGERTRFAAVGGLNDVAVAQALQLTAEQRGVRWNDDALLEAIEIAEGYPHKVQLVGASTWQAARPERGDTLEVGHVRLGRDSAEARMTDLFQTRWARTTGEQRRVLAAMAAAGGDTVARADLATRLRVSSAALSRPRDELIDRGLIEPAGHGELRFTIPGFGGFVRRQPVSEPPRRRPRPPSPGRSR